jgi:parallel beta-helix repeat protein
VSQAVYEATNFHVSNNTITNNDNYGIYFDGAKNNDFSIASNIIKANNYGLYGKGHLDANLIYDNFFENTGRTPGT